MHLDMDTDDRQWVMRLLDEHLDSPNPIRMDLQKKNGRFHVCLRHLGVSEPLIPEIRGEYEYDEQRAPK
jgi:hypothetical protein